jgi:hypothetical protein
LARSASPVPADDPFTTLVSRPREWIDFDPKTLGYSSPRSNILKADIRALRDIYDLEIQTAGRGHPGGRLVLPLCCQVSA